MPDPDRGRPHLHRVRFVGGPASGQERVVAGMSRLTPDMVVRVGGCRYVLVPYPAYGCPVPLYVPWGDPRVVEREGLPGQWRSVEG